MGGPKVDGPAKKRYRNGVSRLRPLGASVPCRGLEHELMFDPIVQSGPGHRPFKPATRVQIPLGSPHLVEGALSNNSSESMVFWKIQFATHLFVVI